MDALKLLSRSTKLSKPANAPPRQDTSSSERHERPQLFATDNEHSRLPGTPSKKRKRSSNLQNASASLDFFARPETIARKDTSSSTDQEENDGECKNNNAAGSDDGSGEHPIMSAEWMPLDERKSLFRKHKLKVSWLNPSASSKRDRRNGSDKKKRKDENAEKVLLHPQPLGSFASLSTQFGLSRRLASNVRDHGYITPTEVQMAALPVLLSNPSRLLSSDSTCDYSSTPSGIDLLTVAPTGSGKTLAFMIPLLHDITSVRRYNKDSYRQTSAIILAPTKELAGQIANEGRKLAQGTRIKISQVRKGMQLATTIEQKDDQGDGGDALKTSTAVKSDVLVSTPGVLLSVLEQAKSQDSEPFTGVRHLVLDEADVLLDPIFREQTLGIWNGLSRSDLRVSLWSATMGSNIEQLARTTIADRLEQLHGSGVDGVHEGPLLRLVVGLKDSAVPNIQHKLVYAASEQGKLMGLRQLLHPATTSTAAGPPLLPPFLIFTQTIDRAVALHAELLYDIPAEAGGISRIAVLHSDLSDTARESVMTRFRRGEIWVLITTDLLSRGVDFRGVNGVVNYDIPTSSAAYVHRVGRTGRAGREGGVAVTLYTKEDIPFLKPIANLVATAQKIKGVLEPDGTQGVDSWLLDALPLLSKKSKQDLKRHGVESRTARGMKKNPKAARQARISTKSGFARREENKRKGAVVGSQRRQNVTNSDDENETEFGGFD